MNKEKKKIGIISIIFIISAIFIFTYIQGGSKELKKNNDTSIFVESGEVANESESNNEKKINTDESKKLKKKSIIVEIKGEVNKPDVYELDEDSIIKDLINLAGGTTKNAVISNINRAKKLQNHELIYISSKDEMSKEEKATQVSGTLANNNSGKVNLNSASIDELKKITGVGDTKAKKIIEHRENDGFFNSIEELKNIDGIGEKTFEKLKDEIEV